MIKTILACIAACALSFSCADKPQDSPAEKKDKGKKKDKAGEAQKKEGEEQAPGESTDKQGEQPAGKGGLAEGPAAAGQMDDAMKKLNEAMEGLEGGAGGMNAAWNSGPRTLTRMLSNGKTLKLVDREGITVGEESFKPLFDAYGKTYMGMKAKLTIGDADCLVEWEAKLQDEGGNRVSNISGNYAARKGEVITVSGNRDITPEEAATITTMETVYYTLCGNKLTDAGNPVNLTASVKSHEKVEFGVFTLEHTTAEVSSAFEGGRCYFDLILEDVDKQGYALNYDYANLSIAGGTTKEFVIRRTDERDERGKVFWPLIDSRRAHTINLECGQPFDPSTLKVDGMEVTNLTMAPRVRNEGDPQSGDELLMTLYDFEGDVSNTLGKDCSFIVRVGVLDKNGIQYHKGSASSATLHLKAGGSGHFKESGIFIRKGQEDELDKIVLLEATAQSDCKYFKEERVLK